MQEEQRSLSSVETLSVWNLLLDDRVRWQVLSVVVINIGMQLSGIDAVSIPNNMIELSVIGWFVKECGMIVSF